MIQYKYSKTKNNRDKVIEMTTTIKIDKRKKYFMVVDVETAGNFASPQIYDFGFAVCDKKGNIMQERSYVISEIFDNQKLMQSAYYSCKIPLYIEGLKNGDFKKIDFRSAREEFLSLMEMYNIKTICAYNLKFDMGALKNTYSTLGYGNRFLPSQQRYSKDNLDLLCIWSFACEVLLTQKTYLRIATENGWVSDAGNLKTNAECSYRYIARDYDFIEEHTGLSDVRIECKILAKCLAQNKKHESGIISHPWRIVQKKHK